VISLEEKHENVTLRQIDCRIRLNFHGAFFLKCTFFKLSRASTEYRIRPGDFSPRNDIAMQFYGANGATQFQRSLAIMIFSFLPHLVIKFIFARIDRGEARTDGKRPPFSRIKRGEGESVCLARWTLPPPSFESRNAAA